MRQSIPAATRAARAPVELVGERRADGSPGTASRTSLSACRVTVLNVVPAPTCARRGSLSTSLRRQLGLERDQGERVAEQVVQVAGDPQPLLGDGEPGELLACGSRSFRFARVVLPREAMTAPTASDREPCTRRPSSRRSRWPPAQRQRRLPPRAVTTSAALAGSASPGRGHDVEKSSAKESGAPERECQGSERGEQQRVPRRRIRSSLRRAAGTGGSTAR